MNAPIVLVHVYSKNIGKDHFYSEKNKPQQNLKQPLVVHSHTVLRHTNTQLYDCMLPSCLSESAVQHCCASVNDLSEASALFPGSGL